MTESRVHKSLLNAKVNLVFYFLSLFFAFFSRKIFLDSLGAEFIGLTGTLGNILGYLNLAELGIGTAITFHLYKPLQTNNTDQLNEIISLLGYLYKIIGTIIFSIAIIISIFFPFIFQSEKIGLPIIYFSFYSFLCSTMIGYFINYKQIILSADQKNYVINIYFQSANIAKTIIQIILAYKIKNPYIWVFTELLFSILACIILNWKISKEYAWLNIDTKNRHKLLKKYPNIITNTKQIFIHKIKDFLLMKSDEIFIFMFVSLKMVAFYGNYIMITSKITMLFTSLLDGVHAGIGNLVAEGRKSNILKIFWEMMFIRHFIAGFLVFTIYNLIEPFICLWLGNEYILNKQILFLLLIYIYIHNSRGVIDSYNHAYGLYADTWSAWVELAINIIVTFSLGYSLGITGILIGKISCFVPIVIFWKPYYLFKSGFKLSYWTYWKEAIKFYAIFFLTFIIGNIISNQIPINPYSNYLLWILYSAIIIIEYLIINLTFLLIFTKGAKTCIIRIPIIRKLQQNKDIK